MLLKFRVAPRFEWLCILRFHGFPKLALLYWVFQQFASSWCVGSGLYKRSVRLLIVYVHQLSSPKWLRNRLQTNWERLFELYFSGPWEGTVYAGPAQRPTPHATASTPVYRQSLCRPCIKAEATRHSLPTRLGSVFMQALHKDRSYTPQPAHARLGSVFMQALHKDWGYTPQPPPPFRISLYAGPA